MEEDGETDAGDGDDDEAADDDDDDDAGWLADDEVR